MMVLQKQYVLLHNALYEALSTKKFICSPQNLNSKMQIHYDNYESPSDLITDEYLVGWIYYSSPCLVPKKFF